MIFSKTISSRVLILLALLFFASSCNEDNEETNIPGVVSPSDRDGLSKVLVFPNGVNQKGNAPAPSTTDAPELEEDPGDIIAVPGSKVIIRAFVVSGDAAGFYVEVSGASSYFKVTPIDPVLEGGREQNISPYFMVEIPSTVLPGNFCLTYSIFDGQNRVSNKVEKCITIKAAGGEGSTFFSGKKLTAISTREVLTFEGVDEEKTIGETEITEIAVGVFCNGIPSNLNAQIENTIEYRDITFNSNGTYTQESSFTSRTLDMAKSGCEAVYKTETDIARETGFWIYDSATKELTLLQTTEEGTYDIQYMVSTEGSDIILTEYYTSEDYFATRYRPK